MPDQRQLIKKGREYPRTFQEWGLSVTLVKGEDGQVYFPVKQICEGIGVDPDHQMRRLNETPEYRAALVDIRLATPGGTQKVACIRRYEAAWWLINLDDARCKSHIRGHLQAIKQRLMDAADAILFGDIERFEEGERGILMVYSRQEFTLACLDCGAVHRVVIVNGEPTVTLDREA
jgi:hypothetical protein